MNKVELALYYEALHDHLEREQTRNPMGMTVKELREANRKMREHLRDCPNGEEACKFALADARSPSRMPRGW